MTDEQKSELELRNNADWDLVNLKNFRTFTPKVSSTGLTILTKK